MKTVTVETGAHRARLLAEGTYRMDFGVGGVLIPKLVTGVRYDFGDAETGFGAEMGGGVTYTYPAWGLTAAGNIRVLLTHQDSGFEQWGGGGSLRVTPGAAGLGPSVAVNTSLGAPASGAQRLWTSGVALGLAPAQRQPHRERTSTPRWATGWSCSAAAAWSPPTWAWQWRRRERARSASADASASAPPSA